MNFELVTSSRIKPINALPPGPFLQTPGVGEGEDSAHFHVTPVHVGCKGTKKGLF